MKTNLQNIQEKFSFHEGNGYNYKGVTFKLGTIEGTIIQRYHTNGHFNSDYDTRKIRCSVTPESYLDAEEIYNESIQNGEKHKLSKGEL